MLERIIKGSQIFLVVLVCITACNIVEPLPAHSDKTGDNEVDFGSRETPTDVEDFALMLHGGSSKAWKAKEFTIQGMSTFLNCRLDDTIILFSNGMYRYDGGDDLCGGEDNQREKTGDWTFDFDRKTLTIERGTENASATILTLEDGLVTWTGVYESSMFGTFHIKGSYVSR